MMRRFLVFLLALTLLVSSAAFADKTGDRIKVPLFNMSITEFRTAFSELIGLLEPYHSFDAFPYRLYRSFPLRPDFDFASGKSLVELLRSDRIDIKDPGRAGSDYYAYYYDLDRNAVTLDEFEGGEHLDLGMDGCRYITYGWSSEDEHRYSVNFSWDACDGYYSWAYNAEDNVVKIDISYIPLDYYLILTYSCTDGKLMRDFYYINGDSPD